MSEIETLLTDAMNNLRDAAYFLHEQWSETKDNSTLRLYTVVSKSLSDITAKVNEYGFVDTFTLKILPVTTEAMTKKIMAIKEIRNVFDLSLKEAKYAVDSGIYEIETPISPDILEELKTKLEGTANMTIEWF